MDESWQNSISNLTHVREQLAKEKAKFFNYLESREKTHLVEKTINNW